ncbi:chromate transporter [Agaricicola taiwanensis]|uniref:Chromate transporter n=1 Tax=Agaricicola taiwanensis TaxID=591372 RepID=A0A8J2Y9W0_9RHOB|nr:chromate transporter [Agaricicola taiwanensis]GGE27522.1 chromate transporter [Agaricicola taiwanensis]
MQHHIPLEVRDREVTRLDLFMGFAKIGLLGFGGVAPWARYVIVEERQWLTEREFAEVLGVGQVLPGPNTMNAAVMIGDRFHGIPGVLLCVLGQMLMPLVIVVTLAMIYAEFASIPQVNAALIGAAAGAAGLVLGTGIKMVQKLKPTGMALVFGGLAFVASGILELPIVWVVGVLAPLSIAAAAFERRHR